MGSFSGRSFWTSAKKKVAIVIVSAVLALSGGSATAAHFDVTAGEAGRAYESQYSQTTKMIGAFASKLNPSQQAELLNNASKDVYGVKINKENRSITIELKTGEDLTVKCSETSQWSQIDEAISNYLKQCGEFSKKGNKDTRKLIDGNNPDIPSFHMGKSDYINLAKREANVNGSFYKLTGSITVLFRDLEKLINSGSASLEGTIGGDKFFIPPREDGKDYEITPGKTNTSSSTSTNAAKIAQAKANSRAFVAKISGARYIEK